MVLNQAFYIRHGTQQVQKVNKGTVNIWQHYNLMPVLDGITDYFDCRRKLTSSTWYNLAGGQNIAWTGMQIQSDGSAGVYGTSQSYGRFISPYTAERTVYIVFKTNPLGRVNVNLHVLGSCGGLGSVYHAGAWFTIHVDGYGSPDYIGSDQWGMGIGSEALSSLYHAVALTRTANGLNKLYIDGFSIGQVYNSTPYCDNWGVGLFIDEAGNLGESVSVLQKFKLIALANTAHTEAQVLQNLQWLVNQFPN